MNFVMELKLGGFYDLREVGVGGWRQRVLYNTATPCHPAQLVTQQAARTNRCKILFQYVYSGPESQERMRLVVVFLLLVGQAFAFTLPHKVDEPFGGLLQTLVSFDNRSHPGHGHGHSHRPSLAIISPFSKIFWTSVKTEC